MAWFFERPLKRLEVMEKAAWARFKASGFSDRERWRYRRASLLLAEALA